MILPVPIFDGGKVYNDIEIIRPTPEILVNTAKERDEGNIYNALLTFVSGGVVLIKDTEKNLIEDKFKIKSLLRKISFKSAEFISIQMLLLHFGGEDGIEGIYTCPRCNGKIICELKKDEMEEVISDTRDFISEMEIVMMKNKENTLKYELKEPLEIKDNTGTILHKIEKIEMFYPTIQHCINASNKIGNGDLSKLQFYIYSEALCKVNDKEINQQFRNMWGEIIFAKMPDANDLLNISSLIDKYGYIKHKTKYCNKCGKKWQANLSTSNFFDSALLT